MLLRLLFIFTTLFPITVYAQQSITFTSAQGHPGDEVELVVSLEGSGDISACQLSIPLPTGISYVDQSAKLNEERIGSHQLSAGMKDGYLNILIHSLHLDLIKGNSGELLRFRLLLNGTPGDYSLTPTVVFGDKKGNSVPCTSTQNAIVTILGPILALSEQAVDFGKVPIRESHTHSFTISNEGNEPLLVTGFDSSSTYLSVSPQSATIDKGKKQSFVITYKPLQDTEEQATIKVISNAVTGDKAISVSACPFSVNELFVQGATGGINEEVTVSVSMSNMEPIVAVQCVFTLSEALAFVEGSVLPNSQRMDGHKMSSILNGQRLSFYLYSSDNLPLKEGSGELFTFRLRLVGAGGSYTLTPEDIVLSNILGQDMTSDGHGAKIRITSPKVEANSNLNFGRVPMTEPILASYALRNSGDQALSIQRIVFTNEAFTVGDYPSEVKSGSEIALSVQYHPSEEGAFEGKMQIYTNDPDNRMIVVDLKGEAYIPNQLLLRGTIVDNHPEQYQLNVGLQNTTPIVAMQFDIQWLPNMLLSKDAITLSSRASGHSVELTKIDDQGNYRCFVYSENNTAIASGSGTVLSILYNNVRVSNDFLGSTLTIKNIILSNNEGQDCASSEEQQLRVVKMSGDANGDGECSVADVVAIVGYILGKAPEGFVTEQADADCNEVIDVNDVVTVINMILKK